MSVLLEVSLWIAHRKSCHKQGLPIIRTNLEYIPYTETINFFYSVFHLTRTYKFHYWEILYLQKLKLERD